MSMDWTNRMWDEATDVKGTTLLVLLCLADHANGDGLAFPSVPRIAKRCRVEERAVYRALEKMELIGLVSRTHREGRSTMYRLHRPLTSQAPLSPETPLSPGTPTPDSGDSEPMSPETPITKDRTTNNDVGVVPEVSTEDPPTPEVSTVEHPFPTFAKAALADHTTAEKNDWIAAWETVDSIAKAWEPTMHLTKYLADRKRNQKRPVAEEWVKWFVQDEHQAQADAAASVEDERDSRPWYE
jgi:hypothetical protein